MAKMQAAAAGNLSRQVKSISDSLEKLQKAFQRTDLGKSIRTMRQHALREADRIGGKKTLHSLSRSAKKHSGSAAAVMGRKLGGAVHLGRMIRTGAKNRITGNNSPSARYQRANTAFQGWAGQKTTQFAGWRKSTGEKVSQWSAQTGKKVSKFGSDLAFDLRVLKNQAKESAQKNLAKMQNAVQEYRTKRAQIAQMKAAQKAQLAQQAAQPGPTAKVSPFIKKNSFNRHFGALMKPRKAAAMQAQQAAVAQQAQQVQQAQPQPMSKLQEAIKRQVINRKFNALMRKTKASMQAQQTQQAAQVQQAAQTQQAAQPAVQPAKKGFFRSLFSPSSWAGAFQNTKGFIQKMRTAPQQPGAAAGGQKKEEKKPKSLMTQISEQLTAFSKWLGQFGLAPKQLFAKTIGAAANLEKQMVLMEHVVKTNQKKFTPDQVTQATKDYMAALRKNAVLNPFSVEEVTKGGMKTLEMAKGDTTKAINYMSIAENVAALKGEKLETVIAAFADAQKGDMSKINKYGFKFSKKDAGGKKGFDRMMAKVEKEYAGGSAKMGGTALGLWESIQEGFSVAMQDSGVEALERLKPQLKRLQEWLTASGGGFDKLKGFAITALGKITDGFLFLLAKAEELFPIFEEMWTTYISPAFEAIGWGIKWLIYNFDELKPYILGIAAAFGAFMIITKVVAIVSGLIAAFSAGGAAIMALTNPIGWIAVAIGLLAVAWQKNWGGIREKTAAFIEWIKPYLAQTITFFQGIFAKLSAYFASIWPPLEMFITQSMPKIMVFLTALWEAFKMVFGGIFDLVSTWVTLMWNTVTSFLGLLGGLFKALIELASGDTVTAMQTVKDTFWGFLEDLASLAEDLKDGLGTFLKNLITRNESGVQALIKVRTEEEQKAKEKLSLLKNPPPKYPQPIDMLGPTNSTPQPGAGSIPWFQPNIPASSPLNTQPQGGPSALASLFQRGTDQGGSPKLSPAQKASIISSGSSGASAQSRGGSQVHVAQLVGEVHIYNDADGDLFLKKLHRHLEVGLGLEGSGVGVG